MQADLLPLLMACEPACHGTGQLPRIIAKLVQVFPYESSDKKQEVLKMVEVREGLGIGSKVWRQEVLWQVHPGERGCVG